MQPLAHQRAEALLPTVNGESSPPKECPEKGGGRERMDELREQRAARCERRESSSMCMDPGSAKGKKSHRHVAGPGCDATFFMTTTAVAPGCRAAFTVMPGVGPTSPRARRLLYRLNIRPDMGIGVDLLWELVPHAAGNWLGIGATHRTHPGAFSKCSRQ